MTAEAALVAEEKPPAETPAAETPAVDTPTAEPPVTELPAAAAPAQKNSPTPAEPVEVKSEPPAETVRRFGCSKCGKVLKSRVALQSHLNRVFPCDLKKDPSPKGREARTCQKCGREFASLQGLKKHMTKVFPCDAPLPSTGVENEPKDSSNKYRCEKCHKTFSTSQKLRLHLTRVYPCDGSGPKPLGPDNKTCPKCNTTYSTTKGLRQHMARVTPCNRPKKESNDATKTCRKCHRCFATIQGFLVHQNRVTPCDQDAQTSVKQSEEQLVQSLTDPKWIKPAEAVIKLWPHGNVDKQGARLEQSLSVQPTSDQPQAIKPAEDFIKLSPQGHDDNHDDPQEKTLLEKRISDEPQTTSSTPETISTMPPGIRKRSADEDADGVASAKETSKRPRCGSTQEDAVGGSGMSHARQEDPPINTAIVSIPTFSTPKENEKHGGDITTDGCCCSTCVKSWARKMSLRMQILGDEVITLRDVVAKGAGHVDFASAALPKEDTLTVADKPPLSLLLSPGSSPEEKAVTDSLTKRYNRLNDQIMTNERALDDSVDYLKTYPSQDESGSLELRSQIDELRVFVNVEKGKRDKAVAAVLAHRWDSKRDDFLLLLETMTVISRPNTEKVLHEECASIAIQMAEKEEHLEELEACTEAEKEAAHYSIQQAAKELLERERDEVFMRLLRSSRRIYLHTKELFSIE